MRVYRITWEEAEILRHFTSKVRAEAFAEIAHDLYKDVHEEGKPEIEVLDVPTSKPDLIKWLDSGSPTVKLADLPAKTEETGKHEEESE